jgi:hypothetical protein
MAMLNNLPDNNMTRCARYADKNDSPFKFLDFENRPEEFKKSPFASGYRSNSRKDGFFFNYNGEYFIDGFDSLKTIEAIKKQIYDSRLECRYAYIDFRVKIDDFFSPYSSCPWDIEDYNQFVKNYQEGRYDDR